MEPLPTRKMSQLVVAMSLLLTCIYGVGFANAWGGASSTSIVDTPGAPYSVSTWTSAHATFYGGDDASGTMGGACGYGNLYTTGFGTTTAALSSVLYNSGRTCGACFEIKCDMTIGAYSATKWCYPNAGSVKITGTNLCPANEARTTDGWCNGQKVHFDMAYPSFSILAAKVAGIIPVLYRRTGCQKPAGLRFCISGNPWFNLVLVYNVAGAGNVVQMSIQGSGSSWTWYNMRRNWGQNWENRNKLLGQSLSFKVVLGNGDNLVFSDVTGDSWQHGLTFDCSQNFDSNM